MNWNGLFTVALALCCLFAVGTVSTTLESSVSTQPDEVIRFDNDALPIGTDAVEDIREAVNRAEGGSSAAAGRDGSSEAIERQSQSSQSSSSTARSQSSQTTEPPSLLDRLLALLRTLLALLVRAAPLVALLAALAAAVYFRDRLLGGDGDERRRTERGDGPAIGAPDPSNDVTNAWFEMVRRFSDADRHAWTPREHAETAAETSDDPEAASALTNVFEEVRYGGRTVTRDRRERARACLDRLSSRADGGTETEDDR